MNIDVTLKAHLVNINQGVLRLIGALPCLMNIKAGPSW